MLKKSIEYQSKCIYLIHYKSDKKNVCSIGKINEVKKNTYEIEHKAKIDYSSAGSPVLLYNNKIIAVEKQINSN